MKNFTRFLFTGVLLLMISGYSIAQQSPHFEKIIGKLVRTTPRLADIDPNTMYGAPIVKTRDENGIIGVKIDKYENPNKGKFASQVLKDMALQVPSRNPSPNNVTASANILQNFDGIVSTGLAPSDNNLAVGPNHVIQIINNAGGSKFQIWNKAGTPIGGPVILSTITGITGQGDPVVMYDQLADRWVITEFAGANINTLVWAVSTSPDPTGTYKIYSYTFTFSADYPHYSVWHNAYYGITHDFAPSYSGSSIYAFDRAAMIAGAATAAVVRFRFDNSVGPNVANRSFTTLPVHQEGPAVSNQSGLFSFFQDDSDTPDPLDVDSIFTFTYTPDFANPANSVIGPMQSLKATPFNSTVCGALACTSQPPGGQAIRGIEGQLMHKVSYRNFGTHESMLANFTTNAGGGIEGIRWWELRRTGGAGNWNIYQEGTYSQPDGNNRFMGSITQNPAGDIGLIFNVTGPGTPNIFPSFRLTGRTTCDPLGQMTIPETSIQDGTVLNGTNRYGDYNALQSDPSNNNFWGTGQYNKTGLGTFGNWATRVVNFSISGGAAQITGQPTNTTVCAGTSASFSVTASGGGTLSYKWQVSTNGGGTWTDIAGATAATYAFTAVAGDNGKQFRCIVSTSLCALTTTSNAAILTITTLSQGGTLNPASPNACAGPNSTTLTLTGAIGNIIQWESSINGGITWTVIANTTNTLTVPNITQTTQYRVLVQSSGCTSAYSSTATINFVAAGVGPISITTDNGTTLCAGDPTLLTAVGSSGPLTGMTYVWTPAAGLNATNTNPVVAAPAATTTYTVVATNTSGCTGTAAITINVNQRPAVTAQPANASICEGSTATFGVTATGTNITYQWQVSTNGGTTWTNLINGAPYGGVTTATLAINPVAAAMNNNRYRCIVSGICIPAATSNGAVLTVKTLPLTPITPAGPLCGGVAGTNGVLLSAGSVAPPVPGTLTVSSGTISVPVADNAPAGATSNLTVSTVPANATITGMRVTFTMPHTYCGDMSFNLKAPNGQILNLDRNLGGTGNQAGPYPNTGFTNTVISSASTVSLSTANAQPITGTFKADAINGITTPGYAFADPTGFVANATSFSNLYSTPNGVWTMAMADNGAGDVGTLTSWSITFDYTTPGATGSPLTYTWSPAAGLYTNANATTAYVAGTQTNQVYAAPTAFTAYTVSGTDATTGCTGTSTVLVNYTPPPPTVTPNPAAMCLGDAAIKLKSSSSTSTTINVTSGSINIAVPDNSPTGAISNLTVSSVPANAIITAIKVTFSMSQTYCADMSINLKAPNGQILNLDRNLGGTGNAAGPVPNTGFLNTIISSTGTVSLSSVNSQPIAGTYKADAINGITTPGYNFADPAGYVANATSFSNLYSIPNGVWTLAMADNGAIDIGVLTNWSIQITYVVGVPSAPAVWSPVAGLFSDANATTPYVAGTAVDSVWAKPIPSGVYPYQVTVNSLPPTPTTVSMTNTPTTFFATLTFNVRNNNNYAVTLTDISSMCNLTGTTNVSAYYKASAVNGLPGAITVANGWNQFGNAVITSAGFPNVQPFMAGLNLVIPANSTYGVLVSAVLPSGTNNLVFSSTGTNLIASAGGCDIITGPNIGYAGPAVPGAPTFTPFHFIGSIGVVPNIPGCTSPARAVNVTVNQPVSITSQPVNASVCTDKVTSFTVTATGTTPGYQWQVSSDAGNSFTNIANSGVYSGATTATLTITAPPVALNGNLYRCLVSGAAPCVTVTSAPRSLKVNPLPIITIAATPYQKLFPGLKTSVISTVSPPAGTTGTGGYTWLRNGTVVPNAKASSLVVEVDGLGDYTLRVEDINGCTNTSNQISITDSASGKVFIYPNPNSGQFQVRYYSIINNTGLPRGVNVYDARGKRVLTNSYSIGSPYARMDVDLRNHGAGVYWIEVVDVNGNRLAIGRVVVTR
jgi:subtilisin-like proprotein convertase family protein